MRIFRQFRYESRQRFPSCLKIIYSSCRHNPGKDHSQCSATRVQSKHAGFSARARIARVLACNLLIFKNPAQARRARVLSVSGLRVYAFCTLNEKNENFTDD